MQQQQVDDVESVESASQHELQHAEREQEQVDVDEVSSEAEDAERSEIEGLLKRLPEEMLVNALVQREQNGQLKREGKVFSQVVQRVAQHYSGPIPPPKMLNEYESVHPGFAERIVSMAEKEQEHRHTVEKESVRGAITKDSRGQHYALIVSLVMIVACTFLISIGHEVAGSIFGGASLLGLAYAFLTGRKYSGDADDDSSDSSV
ncbi:DUF2335 domain-containing protein [Photobacterium sp. MCCC 1A19761]|uniref:DUF2335 domain-containing protein n=1 Tax=Photobacterium sp. MCCC 1A19761 TaxID=3115000 RepID=UPI00307ED4F2